MKPIVQKIWVLLAMLWASISVSAYDFEVDGIYYNLVSAVELTCEVTYGDVKYAGDIMIPAEVKYNNKSLSIVEIAHAAFGDCSSLTSVTIPDSVTKIGSSAFSGCSSLTSVTIPDSVTKIGAYAFEYCSALKSVTIPDSVMEIGDSTFGYCSALTSVTIPDSVTEIGFGAFRNCSALTSVTIPDSVTKIGSSAFRGCSSLTSVTIPDSVTKIGDSTFGYCSALTSVTIPDSVTEIGFGAFKNCSALTSVTIPDSVTRIKSEVFSGCTSLKSIDMGNSVQYLDYGLFQGCKKLQSFTFPESVNTVSWKEGVSTSSILFFEDCKNLKELKFLYNKEPLSVEYLCLNSSPYDKPLTIDHLYIDRKINWGDYTDKCIKLIKQLSLGPNLRNVELPLNCYFSDLAELEIIYCYSLVPPATWGFTNVQYMNLPVRVPNEALEAYQQADVWKNFWNIEGFDPSGTETISAEMQSDSQKKEIGRFDLNGRCVSDDYNGVSVIRYSDGSTKKTVGR